MKSAIHAVIAEMRERVILDGPMPEQNDIEVWADRLALLLVEVHQPPCVNCGTSESADGDWYRLCGTCRWTIALPEQRVIRQQGEEGKKNDDDQSRGRTGRHLDTTGSTAQKSDS